MIYQWKIPNIYNVSVQEAGAEIERCKNGEGFITPEAVVERAKVETSIIHSCFEWNDKNATERYRLHQAGELIRNIVTVNVANGENPTIPVRAFVNIKSESQRGYKSISAVVSNQGEYEYMMDCAKSDLRAFTQKYSVLEGLRGVMSAIQEVLA